MAMRAFSALGIGRHGFIASAVLLLHGLALWALQGEWMQRAVETLVPVQLLGEWVQPPTSSATFDLIQ